MQPGRTPVNAYLLLEGDGLKSDVFSGPGQPAGVHARNGDIWLPTAKGLITFNPDSLKLTPPSIPIIIENITIDGKHHTPQNLPRFSGSIKKMIIDFSILNLRPMKQITVKCRLSRLAFDGYHQEIADTDQKRVVLENLTGGKYHFYLYSASGESEEHEQVKGTYFTFQIDPEFKWGDLFLFTFIILSAVMAVVGLRIFDKRAKDKEVKRIFTDDARYKTSAINKKEVLQYLKELKDVMESEKPYLDPNMTVTKLAKRLNVSKEHISQVVNQELYMNFNHFLNKYRIEEAKRLLRDPKENQFVLLKIAHDVGFNSKSTFNSAFKKITGMSPSKYRESIQKETEEHAAQEKEKK